MYSWGTYGYTGYYTTSSSTTSLILAGTVYTVPQSDINQDGKIDCNAVSSTDSNYLLNTILAGNSGATVSGYSAGDLNYDGIADYTSDLTVLQSRLENTCNGSKYRAAIFY